MKNCSKCSGALRDCSVGSTSMATCSGCAAVWMSQDALRELLRTEMRDRGVSERSQPYVEVPPRPSSLHCPDCSDARLEVIELKKVEVELCPSCRGVLFDPGELPTLAERAAGAVGETRRVAAGPIQPSASGSDGSWGALVDLPLAALEILGDLVDW